MLLYCSSLLGRQEVGRDVTGRNRKQEAGWKEEKQEVVSGADKMASSSSNPLTSPPISATIGIDGCLRFYLPKSKIKTTSATKPSITLHEHNTHCSTGR